MDEYFYIQKKRISNLRREIVDNAIVVFRVYEKYLALKPKKREASEDELKRIREYFANMSKRLDKDMKEFRDATMAVFERHCELAYLESTQRVGDKVRFYLDYLLCILSRCRDSCPEVSWAHRPSVVRYLCVCCRYRKRPIGCRLKSAKFGKSGVAP